jgi:dTMP kinase
MYQGLGRADLRTSVDTLHDLMIGREPDLTFLIDMDPEIGLARALSRSTGEERFENFGAGLQARMRAGFLDLAEEFQDRITVIDGTRSVEEVAADVLAIMQDRLR